MWDAAYATLIGVSGGKSVGGVCGKRDKDFTDGVPRRGGGVGVCAMQCIVFGTSERVGMPWKRTYFFFGGRERGDLRCTLRSLRSLSGK